MPTKYVYVNDISGTKILTPPENRRIKITFIKIVNNQATSNTLALSQVSPDNQVQKLIDMIGIDPQSEKTYGGSGGVIYELDRGMALVAGVSSTPGVNVTITYEIE